MEEKEHLIKLGLALKKCRETKGLSQREMEVFVNLTSGRISEIENGKRNISYLTLIKFLNAFNITTFDFFKHF